jgi:succinate dehydrogenase / fumarate reductase, iron-sulfur subunit
MSNKRTFKVWRGNNEGGDFETYETEVSEGMVVLDVIHQIQAEQAGDLAVRWNCKAGKCGSCSMEINGKPKLACMTRMNSLEPDAEVTVQPLKAFPVIKDLVTDVSWNYAQNKRIPPLKVKAPDKDGKRRMYQEDVDRIQEFRKCIECYLCQDTCHVVRDRKRTDKFVGPRFMIRVARLEMHPLDTADRVPQLKNEFGAGYCNITRCCTEVCPEHINITDNGIIPLKERVVDRYYDPVMMLLRKVFGQRERAEPANEAAEEE